MSPSRKAGSNHKLPPSKRLKMEADSLDKFNEDMNSNSDSESDLADGSESSSNKLQQRQHQLAKNDLYLETVNRNVLDFDSEKVCSVSLSDSNVYGCLTCNRYLRGRSRNSECFQHSINEDHHVFISFSTLKFYVLPENYELDQKSALLLKDIQLLVNPTFTRTEVDKLDSQQTMGFDLNENLYHPGFIGLVNFAANDYSNVVVQALAHVSLLRDYLILHYEDLRSLDLSRRLSLLIRKLWSSHLFKPHVSSEEVVQYVSRKSNKKFDIQVRGSPKDFLVWMLNHMNHEFTKELSDNIIWKIFQGKLLVEGRRTKFWVLPLSLPSVTLFKDGMAMDVPQTTLEELISKKKVQFLHTPKILVLSINRVDDSRKLVGVRNSDLNPTVVRFDPESLKIDEMKYRLVANVVYDTTAENPIEKDVKLTTANSMQNEIHYKVQLRDPARHEWLEINDLQSRPIEKDLLFLAYTCLQFWEAI
ncbi:hypothetical protein FOA43_000686 [Brettanomyces nanus]|uniref:Uncharacterized protein n=1 Tax=Eeniella nana TaxID=13502 RepID=A0A875RWR8_EENNA|nr:uncharacterized protein FOA43_000686 [Brettanomyces nanus]QPG73376.1 hypothetical protein FOA43_000686 [Brettanomyces nanus]